MSRTRRTRWFVFDSGDPDPISCDTFEDATRAMLWRAGEAYEPGTKIKVNEDGTAITFTTTRIISIIEREDNA